ncbi:MAG: outer membrane protein OmpK, partial [Plesiomonas sp.]
MKKFLVSLGIVLAAASTTATAADYSFANMSINKVDWSDGTNSRAGHLKDFDFLEIEAGAGNQYGDVYGFIDFENFASYSKVEDMQVSMKGVTTLNTAVPNMAVYHQTFAYMSKDLKSTDTVIGASYQLRYDALSVRPFLGVQLSTHNASFNEDSFNGMNGMMLGWTAMYDFTAFGEKFQVTNWNEVTFARDSEYLRITGEADKVGLNGAVAAWW